VLVLTGACLIAGLLSVPLGAHLRVPPANEGTPITREKVDLAAPSP